MLRSFVFPVVVILSLSLAVSAQGEKRKLLSKEDQAKFLSQRLADGGITGTFDSYCSLLYSFKNVAIHTEDKEVNATTLHSPFPAFYKPTWKELLDTIAVQTKSSWQYDASRDYWVFGKPATQKPYTITMAEKWSSRDMGIWTGYAPDKYPAGMDIYYYGTYSADNPRDAPDVWRQVRDMWAVTFGARLKKDIKAEEMRKVTIDGVEALYFEAPTPRNNLLWRQWALIKDGKMFFILSTLPVDDKATMAEVDGMLKTFKITQ